jgi:hypothetical protein
MKKVISLFDDNGTEVLMSLDNWGSGVDRLFRRWVRDGEAWRCIETGRTARQKRRFGSIFRKSVSPSFN